ncbi:MAG: VWA domain-containing protein [Anaerolineae bacterium]|nr:VWA domain-containing protein [Anaerolineae bacterium]
MNKKMQICIAHKKGQSLILVAFGIFTLFAFVGLGVDLGLVYVERVRVQRAADAAALAAAAELPLEAAAQLRALEYLAQNGYNCGLVATADPTQACTDPEVRFELNTGTSAQFITGPSEDAADKIVRINTASPEYQDMGRIHVEITQKAPIFFMRVMGFDFIPVVGIATAENIKNLDVVLVFDKSGSMEFDTLCYGCWTPNSSLEHPDGNYWPLPWNGAAEGPPQTCTGTGDPYVYYSKNYYIIEAEDYDWLSNPYDRTGLHIGYTVWVLGRNGEQAPYYMGNAKAYGRDSYGAYLSYAPGRSYTVSDGSGVPCTLTDLNNPDPILGRVCRRDQQIYDWGGPYTAPEVRYTVKIKTAKTYYIWVRGQGGDADDYVFWGLDNPSSVTEADGFGYRGGGYDNGADSSKWKWVKIGSAYLSAGEHTLHFWGGAPGFDLDRFIITDNSDSSLPSSVLSNESKIYNYTNRGWACNPCDARYAGHPAGTGGTYYPYCNMPPQPDRRVDDIYEDEWPIRGAVQAAKTFVRRLDPEFDQIGYVTYSSSASVESELQCLKEARESGGTCTMATIENTIVKDIENTHASGGTNIPYGIKQGIATLSNQGSHNGRPGAAHIMILMTDGRANAYSDLGDDAPACYNTDYWSQNTGSSNEDRAADCTVYFALKARNNGIVIYTITLGESADSELMSHVADVTGGLYRHAPSAEQLGPIFDELYERIFLRLVQ